MLFLICKDLNILRQPVKDFKTRVKCYKKWTSLKDYLSHTETLGYREYIGENTYSLRQNVVLIDKLQRRSIIPKNFSRKYKHTL